MNVFNWVSIAIAVGIFYAVGRIIVGWFTSRGRVSATGGMICEHCGTRGTAKTRTRGSTAIELVLWLCLILPGLVYSIWRLTTRERVCPSCGAPGLIPIDTPRGKQLAGQFSAPT
jgi:hypothetical protein